MKASAAKGANLRLTVNHLDFLLAYVHHPDVKLADLFVLGCLDKKNKC